MKSYTLVNALKNMQLSLPYIKIKYKKEFNIE